MQLDLQTLSVVTVFVTPLLGALLVFAGLQNRAVRVPMMSRLTGRVHCKFSDNFRNTFIEARVCA
jgi:hypothetical protein